MTLISKNQIQFKVFISEINESSSGVSKCHMHEGLLWGSIFINSITDQFNLW